MLSAVSAVVALMIVAGIVLSSVSDDNGTTGAAESAGSASPGEAAPVDPGQFGKPSLPGTDPADPWRGAQPIDGIDPGSFQAALADKWNMEFRTRPLLGGSVDVGLAGDTSRKQRRLDALIRYNNAEVVYQIMCQAGGSEIIPNDDESLRFVADCLATAVAGEDWAILETWLDDNLKAIAEGIANTWFQLPSMRVYVESSRHVISCTLTNF